MNLKTIDEILFKPNTDPWIPRWWLYDVVSVFLHIVVILMMMAPIVCFIVFKD